MVEDLLLVHAFQTVQQTGERACVLLKEELSE